MCVSVLVSLCVCVCVCDIACVRVRTGVSQEAANDDVLLRILSGGGGVEAARVALQVAAERGDSAQVSSLIGAASTAPARAPPLFHPDTAVGEVCVCPCV